MMRRWFIPIMTTALALGSLLAAADSASAAVATPRPGVTHARPGGTVPAFVPGGLMKRPSGAPGRASGVKNQAQSTNWSGYAVTGANGAFTSVSSSWTEPAASCSGSSASVTFSGTQTYTLVLTDSTQGWTQTITQNESGLSRSSAEVITEAPSSSSGVLPLADFGTVNLRRVGRQRILAGRAEPRLDRHDQRQRPGQGLDQPDRRLGRVR